MNRWKASLLHLCLSAVIGVIVVGLMLAVWYPPPYFTAMGGLTLILLLIGVDVVIGPLITLIVFDPRKKNLRFDLAVIAALQLAALAYGCYVMFVARPVYNVFVVDRFEVVAANQVDPPSLELASLPEFRTLPLDGPRIVAARQPDDKRKSDIILQAMGGGPDVANMADLYVRYGEARAAAAKAAQPLADLAKRQPGDAEVIRSFVAGSGRAEEEMGYLPMKARLHDMSVIVDRKTGEVVGMLPVYPW